MPPNLALQRTTATRAVFGSADGFRVWPGPLSFVVRRRRIYGDGRSMLRSRRTKLLAWCVLPMLRHQHHHWEHGRWLWAEYPLPRLQQALLWASLADGNPVSVHISAGSRPACRTVRRERGQEPILGKTPNLALQRTPAAGRSWSREAHRGPGPLSFGVRRLISSATTHPMPSKRLSQSDDTRRA